jgi:hypothetical protein
MGTGRLGLLARVVRVGVEMLITIWNKDFVAYTLTFEQWYRLVLMDCDFVLGNYSLYPRDIADELECYV